MISVCKSADLLLMVLDASKPAAHKEVSTALIDSQDLTVTLGCYDMHVHMSLKSRMPCSRDQP